MLDAFIVTYHALNYGSIISWGLIRKEGIISKFDSPTTLFHNMQLQLLTSTETHY